MVGYRTPLPIYGWVSDPTPLPVYGCIILVPESIEHYARIVGTLLGECRAGPGGAAQSIREAGGGACDLANCRSSLTICSCSFKFVVASF